MTEPVYKANFSFNPLIIIRGGAVQAGVKELVVAAGYVNGYGEVFTSRLFN